MKDSRIPRYRAATDAMREGDYQVVLPVDADDEVAALGRSLVLLGKSLDQRFTEVTTLQRLTEKVDSGLLLEEILNHIFESFRPMIPYDRVGFALLEDSGRVVKSIWARSESPKIKIKIGYSAPLAGSSLEQIIETGHPRILNDLEAHLKSHPESISTRLIVEEGMRSSLTCPLIALGRPVGFLFFSSFAPRTYASAHVATFMQIANQLSRIVEKGRLFRDLGDAKARLEKVNERLANLANVDGLTDIPNRRALDERLSLAWRRCLRDHTPLALLMIDIDHFKRFNDANGHVLGDDCLRSVARALQSKLRRPGDFVGRYGGEEFMVVAETSHLESGADLAQILRAHIETLDLGSPSAEAPKRVTVSIGVASITPARDAAVGDLVEAADRALYRAKENGRNRVECSASPQPPT